MTDFKINKTQDKDLFMKRLFVLAVVSFSLFLGGCSFNTVTNTTIEKTDRVSSF